MAKTNNSDRPSETVSEAESANERRAALKKIGRFAAVSAPAVTLLLTATANPKKAAAVSGGLSSRQLKNPEGAVDNDALLSEALVANAARLDVIDGIGTCLGAVKALHARIDRLEAAL
jgi:hypothetical protein